jgi:hypothetical protein
MEDLHMSEVRRTHCDVRTVPADPNDSDVIISPPTEPEPTWDVRQARAFGRRGDQRAFDVWLCQQTNDHNTWMMLRREFETARAEQQPLEAWVRVWRTGLLPQFTTAGLQGLKAALERDDGRLVTGTTTIPPALSCMAKEPLEACDPLCWALLDGHMPEAASVGWIEEEFAMTCLKASQLCGFPRAVGMFLNWVDETPRAEMRKALLVEVNIGLIGRLPEETPLCKQLRASITAVERNGGLS